jgi:GAF domain-containing protein
MDKKKRYNKVINSAKTILNHYTIDEIAKMSIISSILKNEFNEWIFCGFYRVVKKEVLEIGPYQGNIIPCGHISFNRGVCGASAKKRKTIIVNDVSKFPGYISCDSETISEIVVPVIKDDKLLGVLDVDGGKISQFDATDQSYLEKIVLLI